MIETDERSEYDEATGRLFRSFNPLFPDQSIYTEVTQYDGAGIPIEIKDENSRTDAFLFDAIDRLSQLQQLRTVNSAPVTYETGLDYDTQSNVSQVTDPASKATAYRTDDFGRLVEVTSPDTGVTRYLYDTENNRMTKIENADGAQSASRATVYEYDGLDRLTRIDLPNDPDWIFTYDTDPAKNQNGRLASATNGVVTTAYEYTDRGQVALERSTIDGLSFDTNWTYGATGRIATLRSPGSITTTTAYAGLRPESVSVDAGQTGSQVIANLEWLPFGPRRHAEFPPADDTAPPENRILSDRGFNLRGQIEDLAVTGPSGAPLVHRSYAYGLTGDGAAPNDPGPNLDEMADVILGSDSRYYFYDELDRLWKATDISGNPLFTYTYDAAGNRSQQLSGAGTTTYTYEPGTDRLLRSTGSNPREYGHDAFGSRTYEGTTPPAPGDATHLYNDENRLVQVQTLSPPGVVAQYTYDAFGRRVRKVAGSTTTYYFYDEEGQLLAEVTPRANATDIVRRYVFVEGELMGLVDRWNAEAGTPAWAPAAWFEIPDNLRPAPGMVLVGALLLGAALLARPLRRRPFVTAGVVVAVSVAGQLRRPRNDLLLGPHRYPGHAPGGHGLPRLRRHAESHLAGELRALRQGDREPGSGWGWHQFPPQRAVPGAILRWGERAALQLLPHL